MTRRIIALLAALACHAFASTVTITLTVKGPGYTTATSTDQLAGGMAYIRIASPCRSGSDVIGDRTIPVRITAGVLSVKLVPTDQCPTSGSTGSAWASSTTYAAGAHVQYQGGVWLAVSASANVAPGTIAAGKTASTQTWRLISPPYYVTYALSGGRETTETWQIETDGTLHVTQVASLPSVPVPGPPGCGLVGTDTWEQLQTGVSGCGPITGATTWAQIEG